MKTGKNLQQIHSETSCKPSDSTEGFQAARIGRSNFAKLPKVSTVGALDGGPPMSPVDFK